MPTCLVTGGAGFLGSHLCDELLRSGHRVICVDNLETGSLKNIEHIRAPEFVHLNLDIIEPYHVDEPVNVVNPDEYTLLELAETVIEVTGSRSEIVHEALPTDDPRQRRPDITRARELLGWVPEIDLREGLRRTIEQAGADVLVGATH